MTKMTRTVTAFLMGSLTLAAMSSGAAAEIATNALTPNALTPNGQGAIPSIDLSSSIESIELSNGTVVVLR